MSVKSKVFFAKELPHLRAHQEKVQEKIRRAQRILETITTGQPEQNNVAELILDQLEGFGGTRGNNDALIVAFKDVLNSKDENGGIFLQWYQKWMADITFEEKDSILWCEEDDWVVFLGLTQFFKSNPDIQTYGNMLLNELLGEGRDNDEDDEEEQEYKDWMGMARTFLSKLDNDPFINQFVPE